MSYNFTFKESFAQSFSLPKWQPSSNSLIGPYKQLYTQSNTHTNG